MGPATAPRDRGAVAARPPVLLIGNFLSGSGASRGVCEDLAERLKAAGWSVRTASAKAGRTVRFLEMMRAVWRWRHEYAVAHVDVFSGPAFLWAAAISRALRRLGKPYVMTLRGGSLPEFAARWPRLVRSVLGGARAVAVPSEYLGREMRPYRSDLVLLANPLDLGAYPCAIRRQPRPRIVWLRAFHETYNPALAPRVLALLARDFPDVELTMIGPDRGDGSLARTHAEAAQRGVTGRLRVVGGVAKKAVGEALSHGDVFLNTTNFDNTPVSVLEAMATGLCVVSTDVGGLPDLLRDGEDALLVPPNDPKAMAAAVRRILTEPGLAAKLSQNGRARVEGMAWPVVLPEWESLLRNAAEPRGAE